jgi:hypothetical protein
VTAELSRVDNNDSGCRSSQIFLSPLADTELSGADDNEKGLRNTQARFGEEFESERSAGSSTIAVVFPDVFGTHGVLADLSTLLATCSRSNRTGSSRFE